MIQSVIKVNDEWLALKQREYAVHKKLEIDCPDKVEAVEHAIACDNIIVMAYNKGYATSCFNRVYLPSTTIH